MRENSRNDHRKTLRVVRLPRRRNIWCWLVNGKEMKRKHERESGVQSQVRKSVSTTKHTRNQKELFSSRLQFEDNPCEKKKRESQFEERVQVLENTCKSFEKRKVVLKDTQRKSLRKRFVLGDLV